MILVLALSQGDKRMLAPREWEEESSVRHHVRSRARQCIYVSIAGVMRGRVEEMHPLAHLPMNICLHRSVGQSLYCHGSH